MSEPETTELSSPNQTTPRTSPPQPDLTPRPSAQTGATGSSSASSQRTIAWRPAIILIAIVVVGAGIFTAHQFLSYGALVPSLSGSWYGSFLAVRSDTGQYVSDSTLYVVFSTQQGNQLTATSSICSTAANTVNKQPPTVGVTATGTIDGAHFTMPTFGGDNESNLSWSGTYSTDTVHIDFYPNGKPTPKSPYADLHRGSHDDFLNTCKIK